MMLHDLKCLETKRPETDLIEGCKVPQVFTGQMQVERTHCSLLHCQCLELHTFRTCRKWLKREKTLINGSIIHRSKIMYITAISRKHEHCAKYIRRTWLLNAESLSFFPKASSPFWTISFRSGIVSCPSVNRRVPLFLASVCNSADLDVVLTTKHTPWREKTILTNTYEQTNQCMYTIINEPLQTLLIYY